MTLVLFLAEAFAEASSKAVLRNFGGCDWVVKLKLELLGGIDGRVKHAGTGLAISALCPRDGNGEGHNPPVETPLLTQRFFDLHSSSFTVDIQQH